MESPEHRFQALDKAQGDSAHPMQVQQFARQIAPQAMRPNAATNCPRENLP